jgi:GAF domain-containing protein
LRGETHVAADVRYDPYYTDDPELGDTRSEMTLPLRARGEIIGALAVQSLVVDAFTDEDQIIMQTLSDQLALAISNARLYRQAQESLEAERRASGELGREAWVEMVRARPQLGYRYAEHEVVAIGPDGAGAEGDVGRVRGTLPELTLPVKYRDEVLGTIKAHKPAGAGDWTPEEISLMETLVEQLSVALDSARLHEQTQRRAAREELLGGVATRIRETLDMESVLRTTAQEVRQALGLPEVVIRIGGHPALAGQAHQEDE